MEEREIYSIWYIVRANKNNKKTNNNNKQQNVIAGSQVFPLFKCLSDTKNLSFWCQTNL